ncbi:hypothetical protein J7K44_00720 [bacterium]|nr:hypothetical protein [bacterium]
MLIGSINYELLLKEKIIDKPSLYKGRFVEKFKENLGVKALTDSFRNYAFNIHYHHNDNKLK